MIKQSIVLAGGLGTRLQKVVPDIPKPMAEVAGKPFLKFILDYLDSYGIEKVVLAVGYKRQSIIQYFGSVYGNMRISYSIEEEPLGTGGAILQATQMVNDESMFVINGDTFFNVNLSQLYDFHIQKNAQLTIALRRMHHFDRYGTVDLDSEGKISGFKEKRFLQEGLINGGVYCMRNSVFPSDLPKVFSFEKEVLESGFANSLYYGIEFNNYFIDIGIPGDYERAQLDFSMNRHLLV